MITDLTDGIDRDKCLGVYFFHIVHQRLVLLLVHNGDDFLFRIAVIRADNIIEGCAAVLVMENEVHDLVKLGRNDTDTALQIHAENEVIHHKSA